VLAAGSPRDRKVLHEGVGGRGEQALVTVLPPDPVRWRATLTADLYDHSLAVYVADMASPDYEFIADYRMHDVIPLHLAAR
jgi:hypothetical protein